MFSYSSAISDTSCSVRKHLRLLFLCSFIHIFPLLVTHLPLSQTQRKIRITFHFLRRLLRLRAVLRGREFRDTWLKSGHNVGRRFHVGRCPAFFLFGLTTPISPGSVSVCFTVTWITGLGRFRASIIMATLSGTVLLFLLDKETREEKFNDKETGRQRGRESDGEIMEAHTSLRITITFRGNHPTFMPSLTCFDTKIRWFTEMRKR